MSKIEEMLDALETRANANVILLMVGIVGFYTDLTNEEQIAFLDEVEKRFVPKEKHGTVLALIKSEET